MEGILLAHKPINITSAHFLNLLKKKLNLPRSTKVGHGGTLDKFASGLLVVGIGRRFTKELHQTLTSADKEYQAIIELGKESSTDDPEGEITVTSKPLPTLSAIQKVVLSLPLNQPFPQTAPVYSAKKYLGRRLSDLARLLILKKSFQRSQERQNKNYDKCPPPPSKLVTIFNIRMDDYSPPLLRLRLTVSSGFYVRAFARDLGQTFHCGAYLKELTRVRISGYLLTDALSLPDLDDNITLSIRLEGDVQGIGFRAFLHQQMEKLNLSGSAANLPDGSVSLSASGPLPQLIKLSETALAFPPHLTNYYLLWKK